MKVFLVEDEFVIREGIKKNIDWEGNGYTFAGEAADGELALPLITREQPDIVITDIKMPFMDGLELSRLIKQKFPNIEIIILSGYDEFEYAKEGISIGVAQYLLKPISGADLLKEVNEVRDRIYEKQKELALYERYKQETEENRLSEKKDFFTDLVSKNQSVTDLMERAKKLDMDITAVWYNVVLIMTKSVNHELGEYSKTIESITGKLYQIIKGRKILSFDRALEGIALIFMGDTLEELEKEQRYVISSFEDLLKDKEDIKYFGGIGTAVNRLRELDKSFENAERAYAQRYLIGNNRFISCDDISNISASEDEDVNLGSIDPKQIDVNKLSSFLKTGDISETKYFVEVYFNKLGSAARSQLFRQYILMNCFFAISEFLDSIGESKESIGTLASVENFSLSIEETRQSLIEVIENVLDLRDCRKNDKVGNIVDKVKEIVSENYSDSELSLSIIASKVNFSPNHLSMIFSHETGQTLIKYLTDYRLNKAKELLKCTSLKGSEISEKVGYPDPHYFSYLFKKTYGITPTQYRDKE